MKTLNHSKGGAFVASLLVLVALAVSLTGQSIITPPGVAVQQATVPQGSVVTMNCSTNVTCSVSGGVVTVTAATSGGIVNQTTGSTDPSGSCTAASGSNLTTYFQTTLATWWVCDSNGVWQKVLSTTNSGQYVVTGAEGSAPSTPASGFVSVDRPIHKVREIGPAVIAMITQGWPQSYHLRARSSFPPIDLPMHQQRKAMSCKCHRVDCAKRYSHRSTSQTG